MPFAKDPGTRESNQYCSLCFKDGQLCYQGDLADFQKICYKAMVDSGMHPLLSKFYAWCIRFAPRWKDAK